GTWRACPSSQLCSSMQSTLCANEKLVDQHGRQNADERHVVRKSDGPAVATLLHELADRDRIEIAGGSQALGAQEIRDIIDRLTVRKEAHAIGCAIRLLGAVRNFRG